MLGREGPSIRARCRWRKKELLKWLKSSPVEERSLIASGAAAGLAAAFNAPIAGVIICSRRSLSSFFTILLGFYLGC